MDFVLMANFLKCLIFFTQTLGRGFVAFFHVTTYRANPLNSFTGNFFTPERNGPKIGRVDLTADSFLFKILIS